MRLTIVRSSRITDAELGTQNQGGGATPQFVLPVPMITKSGIQAIMRSSRICKRWLTKSAALEAADSRPVVKCHRSTSAMRLLTRLRRPRADSRESIRRDSGDVAGDVAHRGRRKFGLRTEVERSQALQ